MSTDNLSIEKTQENTINFSDLELNPQLLKALEKSGYNQPTPIQAQAIPRALLGKDLIATAQTGTGKTAAFVLPALERLTQTPLAGKARILILTPTRELATQITDAIAKYGSFLRINTVSVVGGMPYPAQLRQLSRPVDVIVATPGRLIDHLERGKVDLSAVQMLVLDEADRMLDMGFIDAVKHIAASTPETRQTLLFTATMDEKLARLARTILREPERIEIASKTMTLDQIEQRLYVADDENHKYLLLQHLIEEENMDKAIIFSATKRNADMLARKLYEQGHATGALHGDMNQHRRNKTITSLRRNQIQFLVATDVAARGIDISDISHVINYDLPKFAEDYVHRIGRTGRAGRSGIAISLILANEGMDLRRIERYTKHQIAEAVVPGLEPKKRLSHSEKPANKRNYRHSNNNKPRSFKQGGNSYNHNQGHSRGYAERSYHQKNQGQTTRTGYAQTSVQTSAKKPTATVVRFKRSKI